MHKLLINKPIQKLKHVAHMCEDICHFMTYVLYTTEIIVSELRNHIQQFLIQYKTYIFFTLKLVTYGQETCASFEQVFTFRLYDDELCPSNMTSAGNYRKLVRKIAQVYCPCVSSLASKCCSANKMILILIKEYFYI